MANKPRDLSGQRFGLIVVTGFSGKKSNSGNYIWNCVCDCGKHITIFGGNLRKTRVNSCGCYKYNRIDKNRQEKACSKCGKVKPKSDFNKNKSRKDGYSQFCKLCIREIDRHYRPRQLEWRAGYQREKRAKDLNFRMAGVLRRRFKDALKGKQKWSSVINLIGCTLDEFTSHIERKFYNGMTWENYGKYWHIDHIKPCAAFDLSDPEQQKQCFNYSNTQPLLANENISKNSWYDGVRYRHG